MKKNELTEQERYELAKELHDLSIALDVDAEEIGLSDKEVKYRDDLLNRAIAAICPGFMQRFADELNRGLDDAAADFAEAERLGMDPFSDEFLHRNDPIPEGGNILPFKSKEEKSE